MDTHKLSADERRLLNFTNGTRNCVVQRASAKTGGMARINTQPAYSLARQMDMAQLANNLEALQLVTAAFEAVLSQRKLADANQDTTIK